MKNPQCCNQISKYVRISHTVSYYFCEVCRNEVKDESLDKFIELVESTNISTVESEDTDDTLMAMDAGYVLNGYGTYYGTYFGMPTLKPLPNTIYDKMMSYIPQDQVDAAIRDLRATLDCFVSYTPTFWYFVNEDAAEYQIYLTAYIHHFE